MSDANARQHGGDHYKKHDYQHWDFVCDTGQHYLVACATKYASRWQNKGGVVDLEKMMHYLDKALERGITAPHASHLTHRFCEQLEPNDALMVDYIMRDEWDKAKKLARQLISQN